MARDRTAVRRPLTDLGTVGPVAAVDVSFSATGTVSSGNAQAAIAEVAIDAAALVTTEAAARAAADAVLQADIDSKDPSYIRLWDYVPAGPKRADGADATAEVQAALDAAEGATLYLDEGVYRCDSPLDFPNDIVVCGPRGTVLHQNWTDDADGSQLISNAVADGTGGRITLRGFTVRGNHDGTPWGITGDAGYVEAADVMRFDMASDIVIDDVRVENASGPSIVITNCSNGRVTNNEVDGVGRGGIVFYGWKWPWTDNWVVTGNRVTQSGDDCIAVWADAVASPGGQNGIQCAVTTTVGSSTLTGVGTTWVSGDVGKLIAVEGAGPAGTIFEARIKTRVSNTEITVDDEPSTAVTGANGVYDFRRPRNFTIGDNVLQQSTAADGDDRNAGRCLALGGLENSTVSGNTMEGGANAGVVLRSGQNALVGNAIWSRAISGTGNTIKDGAAWGRSSQTPRSGVYVNGLADSDIEFQVERADEEGWYITDAYGTRFGGSAKRCGFQGVYVWENTDNLTFAIHSENNNLDSGAANKAGMRFNPAVLSHYALVGSTVVNNDPRGVLVEGPCIIRVTGSRVGDTRSISRVQADSFRLNDASAVVLSVGNDLTGAGTIWNVAAGSYESVGDITTTTIADNIDKPLRPRSTGWAATNVTTTKTLNANSVTLDGLADVVGSIIAELIADGRLSA